MSDFHLLPTDLAQAGFIAAFALLVLAFAVLKTAFRFLSPVEAQALIEREGLGEDAFLRKSLLQPTPLWFSLQIGGLLSLLGLAASLASRPPFGGGENWTPLRAVLTAVAGVLAFLCLELLVPLLVVGARGDRVLLRALPVLTVVHAVFGPLSRALARLVDDGGESQTQDTDDEEPAAPETVDAFIEVGEREGIIDESEGEMIKGVVEFGDTIVREVMTPRTDVTAVSESATVEEVCRRMTEAKHTKVPLYRGAIDNVEGILLIKDLLGALVSGRGAEPAAPFARPTLFVPETTPVRTLLADLQRRRMSLAIVVDEYGGMAGIASVEDLLEEIVGEIHDEHEAEPPEIAAESEGVWAVDGRASLDDLREALDAPLEVPEDVDTAGGFVVAHLGRVPRPGERLIVPGHEVQILDADERRILRMRFRRRGTGRDGRSERPTPAAGA